jgi:hypothetical protein
MRGLNLNISNYPMYFNLIKTKVDKTNSKTDTKLKRRLYCEKRVPVRTLG